VTLPTWFKKGLMGAVVVGGGLATGTAVSLARGGAGEEARETLPLAPQEHSAAAYDRATARFTGRLGPRVLAAAEELSSRSTVLVVVRGADVKTCEDLGRQLRELHRAVPAGGEWGMALLVDSAGEAELRGFLAREHITRLPVLVADPAGLLEGGAKVATPAALVVGRDGQVRAGVSHPSRFKNVRGRSFAQELPLSDPGAG
jgi:hypothetical protein